MNNETVREIILGVIETLTNGSHELALRLYEAELDTAGLLDILNGVIGFVSHNLGVLQKEISELDNAN